MAIQYAERKSLRLPSFDYSQAGAYFVTICSNNKECIFGYVTDSQMNLNKLGSFVASRWQVLSKIHAFVSIDRWVIMPNHLHGILWLAERNPDKKSLSELICSFKSNSTLQARKVFAKNINLWQRGFYEHIIRDENDLFRIRQYIEDNPVQWAVDSENPDFYNRIR